jgi:hypothetical protein
MDFVKRDTFYICGYAPDEAFNLYFEYYPKSVHGDYELWVPVIRADET